MIWASTSSEEGFLGCVWLYLHTPQAHLHCPRRPCCRGHRCSQDCLWDSPVLLADTRPSERIASNDFHQPPGVSDRSIVSGFFIGAFLRTDFQNRFVQHFVGSFRCFERHRQVPSSRCRCEIIVLPCSRIKTETLSLWSKTDPSSTISHLSDSHHQSSTIDLSTLNDNRLSWSIQSAQNSLSVIIHFVSTCSAVPTSKYRFFVNRKPTRCWMIGGNNCFACSGINAKCDGSLGRIKTVKLKRLGRDGQNQKFERISSPRERDVEILQLLLMLVTSTLVCTSHLLASSHCRRQFAKIDLTTVPRIRLSTVLLEVLWSRADVVLSFLCLCLSFVSHIFLHWTSHTSVSLCHFHSCHLSILSMNLCEMTCSFVSNTDHDVFSTLRTLRLLCSSLARTPTLLGRVSVFSHLLQLPWNESISIGVGALMVFLASSIGSTSRTKFDQLSHLVARSKRCSLMLLWPIPAMAEPIFNESLIVSQLWASSIMTFLLKVVLASRRSPSNGVRKISASFPTTLILLVGSYLLTNTRQTSNPSPSVLVRTTFSALPLQKRINAR